MCVCERERERESLCCGFCFSLSHTQSSSHFVGVGLQQVVCFEGSDTALQEMSDSMQSVGVQCTHSTVIDDHPLFDAPAVAHELVEQQHGLSDFIVLGRTVALTEGLYAGADFLCALYQERKGGRSFVLLSVELYPIILAHEGSHNCSEADFHEIMRYNIFVRPSRLPNDDLGETVGGWVPTVLHRNLSDLASAVYASSGAIPFVVRVCVCV